jgi:hypothetical protein
MAVIKYDIKGTVNTKPIQETQVAAEGMFKKIQNIDNMLKGFVGVKVFSEVTKAINNSLKEYDKFKNSLNEESSFTKQFKDLQTTLAGTVGNIRDSLFTSFSNIFDNGQSFINTLKDAIPKIGSNLIGAIKVAEAIIINIKNNFNELLKPGIWDDFFRNAGEVATNFCILLGNALVDAFKFALDFLIWGLKDLNIIQIIFAPLANISKGIFERIEREIPGFIAAMEKANENNPANRNRYRGERDSLPSFNISDSTVAAFQELGNSIGKTVGSALNTLTGTDASAIFNRERDASFEELKILIKDMEEAADKNTTAVENLLGVYRKEKESIIKNSLSSASKGFNDSTSNINSILGGADSGAISIVRKNMEGLNNQFEATSTRINELSEMLKSAETTEEIDSIFNSLIDNITKMTDLSKEMDSLQQSAEKAKNATDLLQGALSALGELGQVIQMIMSGNVIGIVVTLMSKLADTFSNLSSNMAATMNIISVLFDVIEEVCSELEPWLDTIFKPLLDIVSSLGLVIGNLLNIIIPVIGVFMNLLNTFNVFTPVLNLIAIVAAAAADAIGFLYNAVSEFVYNITAHLVNIGKMATNNIQKTLDAISQENDYTKYSNSNNSTSYSVAGDMYINIYYEHSFVNGDARTIALGVRDEIRKAEGKGY